jgi:hypothetical protein
MTDEKKIAQYNAEMVKHSDGAAQFFDALIGGRFVTREQTRDMADYVLAQTKRNIERCPFASREEKDAEIHRREYLMKMLKSQMGL